MNQADEKGSYGNPGGGGDELMYGSSFESFADAVRQALSSNPSAENRRRLRVESFEVEEGGVVGRVQYHVALNPQPLPPQELNPQPLPPQE